MSARYHHVRELGRGMAGVVHEALAADGRRVVVKSLRPHVARQEGVLERFRREATLMAGLRHPNVMPVLDVQPDADPPYYVMPWVEGRTLSSLLAEGPPPLAKALEVLRGIATALVELHRQGLVHRDLKPENVLLPARGGLLLFDFGLAKRSKSTDPDVTKQGQILGTPAYMSPEQIRSGAVDGRTDVYALGVIAHELVTGRNPFLTDDVVESCRRHLADAPPRLDEGQGPPASARLATLVAAMLAKPRDQRPSALRVLEALAPDQPAQPRPRRPVAALSAAPPLPRSRPAAPAPCPSRAPTATTSAPDRTTPRPPTRSSPPAAGPTPARTRRPEVEPAFPSPAARVAAARGRPPVPATETMRRPAPASAPPAAGLTGAARRAAERAATETLRRPAPAPVARTPGVAIDVGAARALALAALGRRGERSEPKVDRAPPSPGDSVESGPRADCRAGGGRGGGSLGRRPRTT